MQTMTRLIVLFVVSFVVPLSHAMLPDFTGIVEDQSPAVVKITTVTHAKARASNPYEQYGVPQDQIPEIFKHFFGQPQQPQQRQSESLGSGFIISRDGYVVTNDHVIANADEITVRLPDRREYTATLVGSDQRSDIALLKIDTKDKLPAVEFGDSDDLSVGEWVLAIGSPFGLDYSVSAGIVSAIGRSIPNGENGNYVPFIQTDVAINPGNSGGPLFDLEGRVVGVNSQIYTTNGGSVGLSFSIPARLVQDVVAQLKDSGEVKRGWLGVGIQNVDRELATSFGLDKPSGALITHVDEDSPADKGGIDVGDVIVRFNDVEVESSDHLPAIVGLIKPGTSVPVDVIRGGESKRLKVKVGTLDAGGDNTLTEDGAQSEQLGLRVQPIPDDYADRWGVNDGVIVAEVSRQSPAAKARLRRGDIITSIANIQIRTIKDYMAAVRTIPVGKPVPVRIIRSGRAGYIALTIPE